jgi:hypothetical protein
MIPPINDPTVQIVFDAFPKPAQDGALVLRGLIFETAADLPDVSLLTECLRWGQPSYITPIGSALRIGIPKHGAFALFAHCQSTIISQIEQTFGNDFCIEGNRAVLFDTTEDIQPNKLRLLIEHALTYKRKTS